MTIRVRSTTLTMIRIRITMKTDSHCSPDLYITDNTHNSTVTVHVARAGVLLRSQSSHRSMEFPHKHICHGGITELSHAHRQHVFARSCGHKHSFLAFVTRLRGVCTRLGEMPMVTSKTHAESKGGFREDNAHTHFRGRPTGVERAPMREKKILVSMRSRRVWRT
jgi:hypothetical protein